MFTETCEAPKEISCYSLNHSTQQVESKDFVTREGKKKKKAKYCMTCFLI